MFFQLSRVKIEIVTVIQQQCHSVSLLKRQTEADRRRWKVESQRHNQRDSMPLKLFREVEQDRYDSNCNVSGCFSSEMTK